MKRTFPHANLLAAARAPQRLEREAVLAGIDTHLDGFILPPDAVALDVGCGSGAMTRLLAGRLAQGHVTGIDVRQSYIDFAERLASEWSIANITFTQGDLSRLPFDDNTFDWVWCKYMLQGVADPAAALMELKRVAIPGGLVICCDFDGFGINHDPVDPMLQADAEVFFNHIVDPFIGRKMYRLFRRAGFAEIKSGYQPDRLFSTKGAIDRAHREVWEMRLRSATLAMVDSLGSVSRANQFTQRFLAYQDRPDTASRCFLFFVSGRVPHR